MISCIPVTNASRLNNLSVFGLVMLRNCLKRYVVMKFWPRLKAILAELREVSNGSYGIVTKKSRRLHYYWLARNNFRPSAGARLHRWDEMIAIAEVALAQTCVRVWGLSYFNSVEGFLLAVFFPNSVPPSTWGFLKHSGFKMLKKNTLFGFHLSLHFVKQLLRLGMWMT